MSRLTLLQRLKPEVKTALEASKKDYSFTVNYILGKLDDAVLYKDLTLDTIRDIYTFANMDWFEASNWDLKYGDNLFND